MVVDYVHRYGMHGGFMMRQQAISAIHAKMLRLNSASIAAVSVGKVVNLVSNDVRRFDDIGPYYMHIWAGPLEVICVLVMVGAQLTFPAAIAGIATLLLLIPFQGVLSKHIARLRTNTARHTDERVRLAGEVIAGSLAVKMLGWEDAMLKLLKEIRAKETSYAIRMARIRAMNMALYFFITPLVSFIVFTVVHVQGKALDIASVFYALALLHLPKLSMAQNFVHAVEAGSELQVSMKRINDFLSLPEPPAPAHHLQGPAATIAKESARVKDAIDVALGGADYDWNRWAGHPQPPTPHLDPTKNTKDSSRKQTKKHRRQSQELKPQEFSVNLPDEAVGKADPEVEEEGSSGHDIHGACGGDDNITLHGLKLQVAQGELLGICGEVGSGKSSLLAALLGELQPLDASLSSLQQPGAVPIDTSTGPVMKGTVAYCCQVPWVDAGTIRDNIVFGKAYEEQWYVRVVTACALTDDLAMLPWGDLTEIGERGVNLSGGQKARLALARAAYSRADIMLLDDPLSAVDPRVGRILFQECLGPQGIMQGSTRLLVTHQRHFLPQCDRILVLKDGCERALGTYSQLASSALTELTQLAEETELDDAVYDEQILTQAPQSNSNRVVDESGTESRSALRALNAGPVQATLDAEVPAATVAASQTGNTADHLTTGQHMDGGLASSVPSDSLATLATATTASAAVAAAGTDLHTGDVSAAVHTEVLRSDKPAPEKNLDGLHMQPSGPGHKEQAAFCPAHVVKKKFVLPPKVDLRWRPVQLCEKWYFRLRGYRKAHKPEDEGVLEEEEGKEQAQLNQQEGRASGSTSLKVYFEYFRYCGRTVMWIILAGLMLGQAVFVVSEYWLATWARQSYQDQREAKWIWVYGMLVIIITVIAIVRAVMFFHFTFKASSAMHDEVAQHVLRAPLAFFHTNPTGRILNRFSKDQGTADDHLPQVAFDATQSLFLVAGALILMIIAVPFVLPTLLPLVVAFFWLRHRYITTGREVKRFDATTRSPVYASFSAALKGLPTIRAYDVADHFKGLFVTALDRNSSWWYAFLACSRWVGFRLDTLAAITLSFECILVMAVHQRVSTRLVGLALAHVLNMSGMMQWAVRQTAETENDMTSVERMLEYTKLPQEPPTVKQGGGAAPAGWPASGTITYENVTASYRPGLPPVLSNLSFTIQGGMSVGIVGRTGSGKSSLMLTLFRLIDQLAGRILIDGVDIASLGIDALRSQLAIIPQDPVLFSGSLRSNMDPEGSWPDHKLWEALAAVQLKEAVVKVGGLDAKMEEGGDNLSVGQRQLFCLARALLQDAQILALDEATANVDSTTDALIQQTLKDCTQGQLLGGRRRTLLVIAHRINTIMDSDMLLVLSDGKLVEQGSPIELSQKPGGTFARLVQAAQQSHV
ncbi:TPA: hypothetical protein ACH3X1_010497 [Trebouxia sp. C0004]